MKALGRELSLRVFSFSDLPAILALENRAYAVPWSLKGFEDSLHVRHECKALWEADRIVGYYVAQTIFDETHLLNICIDLEKQRQGLGELLLLEWLQEARARGSRQAFLEVRVSNLAAQALYRKCGFERLSRRKGYYRTLDGKEDGWAMCKPL